MKMNYGRKVKGEARRTVTRLKMEADELQVMVVAASLLRDKEEF